METAAIKTPIWKIIQFDVTEANDIVQIEGKLPAHLTKCKGIYFSIKNYLDTAISEIPEAGEISLRFNSRKTHPVHDTIGYSKVPTGKRPVFKKLSQKLLPNQSITGFYLDYGKTNDRYGQFKPYTVNIYFECENIKEMEDGQ